mmetsp:Transcript_52049/g.123173  ORF Transcript_52049/g.123173 Transcript_52049/m.123173 type:complete len:107 (-) Transcript_52049:161-481(-)
MYSTRIVLLALILIAVACTSSAASSSPPQTAPLSLRRSSTTRQLPAWSVLDLPFVAKNEIAKPKNDGHVLQKPAFVINSEKIENTGRSIAMVLGATVFGASMLLPN